MNKFVTNKNLDEIVSIFREYMNDKFNVKIPEEDQAVSSLAQQQIHRIAGNATGRETLQDLNLQVLGYLRKFYLSKMNRSNQAIRDSEVFANRKVIFNNNMPADTSMRMNGNDLAKRMDMLSAQRLAEFPKPSQPSDLEPSIKEAAETSDDFLARVREFERERSKIAESQNLKNIEIAPVAPSKLRGASSLTHTFVNEGQGQQHQHEPQESNRQLYLINNSLDNVMPGQYNVKYITVKYNKPDFDLLVTISHGNDTLIFKKIDHVVHSQSEVTNVLYEPIVKSDANLNITIEKNNIHINASDVDGYDIVLLRLL